MNHLRTLSNLFLYRNLLQDDLLQQITHRELQQDESLIANRLIETAEKLGLSGNLFNQYLIYLISKDANTFTKTAEQKGGKIGDSLFKAATGDIKILREILSHNTQIFKQDFLTDYKPTITSKNKSIANIKNILLAQTDDETATKNLCQHYQKYGYGMFSDFMAFKYDSDENQLIGINSCDDITFDDLIGYERQKQELIDNTKAFLQNLPANNVLLYGERGTGKSSSIKALINMFFDDGLRLVEISRTQFGQLPTIMSILKNCGKKFILCLDDLSFEEFEVEYKQLKSTIDGGLEVKPDNVLIYATSNRRNIIKEVWADNDGSELHRTDTINEKISLADRFGVKIFFISPDQNAYFKIITELAKKSGLNLTEEQLKKEAIKWEMTHTGRSGRTAEQLITYLLGSKQTN